MMQNFNEDENVNQKGEAVSGLKTDGDFSRMID